MIADRLASLGTLVAGVAHEINNPITYVLGNLGDLDRLVGAMREAILTYRGSATPDVIASAETKIFQAGGLEALDEILSDAQEGAVRIRDLVRDLLLLCRVTEQASTPVNVHEILDSSLRLVAKQLAARAVLVRDYRATRKVAGDRARLAQVFMNLITNAMQACTPPDPPRHSIVVRTQNTDAGIELEIQDSGNGIPEEIQHEIFTPFFTTKDLGEGTGLGLYISRRIIEQHSGSISFRCPPSGGTIFRVHLPECGVPPPHPPQEG
ncbi:MAG: ATP-binding protein [Deltaproteobacteria bacterium]|nr:ATP-binding protein [Deltaproteobacteria bacterium]